MATIESQIGSVSANSGNQPMRRYVVDDPTMNEPIVNPYYKPEMAVPNNQQNSPPQQTEEEKVYFQYQEAKRQKNKISIESKNKIEALLGLRKITKSITIDGIKITLRNLNAHDTKLAFKIIAENAVTNVDLMFYGRNIYLALSLYELNGEKISSLLGEEAGIDVALRLSLVEEMSEELVKELHTFYEKEIGINIPQTEKDIKEVNSEIKKS